MPQLNINNIKDISDKIALEYFFKISKKNSVDNTLTIDEKRNILKKIRRKHLVFSATIGALGVLLLFTPVHLFPELFKSTSIKIPFINYTYDLSITELLWGFLLVGIEIWLLIKSDLKTVSKIAAIYGYIPESQNKNTLSETEELLKIGLGKDRKKFSEIGINPYQTLPKIGLILLRLMFLVKAFLSNFVFRILIKKILGRIAVRSVTDFAALPIYAFWNAYSASVIIRRADMRMHAQNLMQETGEYFYEIYKQHPQIKSLIYDTLEFVAITKKNFYPTDYLFANHILKLFDIPIIKEHILSENYLENVKNAPDDIREAIGKIMILAFLIDGKFGLLEKRILKKLKEQNIIPYNMEVIEKWTKEYVSGKGFDEMLNF